MYVTQKTGGLPIDHDSDWYHLWTHLLGIPNMFATTPTLVLARPNAKSASSIFLVTGRFMMPSG